MKAMKSQVIHTKVSSIHILYIQSVLRDNTIFTKIISIHSEGKPVIGEQMKRYTKRIPVLSLALSIGVPNLGSLLDTSIWLHQRHPEIESGSYSTVICLKLPSATMALRRFDKIDLYFIWLCSQTVLLHSVDQLCSQCIFTSFERGTSALQRWFTSAVNYATFLVKMMVPEGRWN